MKVKLYKILPHFLQNSLMSSPMIYFDETGDWGFGKSNPIPDKNSFKKGAPHTHAPAMIRTTVMKEIDGYTDTKRTVRVEDYYLWYKIYKAGYQGYNLQEHLYKMRDDRNAMARRKPKDRLNSLIIYFKITRDLKVVPSIFVVLGVFIKIIMPAPIMRILRKRRLSK